MIDVAEAGARRSIAALDVGGTSLRGTLFDSSGGVLSRRTIDTFSIDGDALSGIVHVLDSLQADAVAGGHELSSIGVAVPGIVDDGTIAYAANLGFSMLPLARILSDRFGVRVTVEHDARAAAAAELVTVRETRPDLDDFVFVPIGTGISAAIVSGGRFVRGGAGGAGEFGHQVVVPDGEPCGCGQRGCVEAYASAANILRRYRESGGAGADSTEQIAGLLDRDHRARVVWDDAVAALAAGIASLTAVLDPRLVVIGGGLSRSGETLLAPLRIAVARNLTWRSAPEIALTEVGSDAGSIGAAVCAEPELGTPAFVATALAELALTPPPRREPHHA